MQHRSEDLAVERCRILELDDVRGEEQTLFGVSPA
jgi:hypothetical protein